MLFVKLAAITQLAARIAREPQGDEMPRPWWRR